MPGTVIKSAPHATSVIDDFAEHGDVIVDITDSAPAPVLPSSVITEHFNHALHDENLDVYIDDNTAVNTLALWHLTVTMQIQLRRLMRTSLT